MDMRPYIASAIAGSPKALATDVVTAACASLGISQTEFCDCFAKQVVREYTDGELPWRDAEVAMNALSGFFFLQLPNGAGFPDYAFGVFLAFDAGETEADPEPVTKAHLERLHAEA